MFQSRCFFRCFDSLWCRLVISRHQTTKISSPQFHFCWSATRRVNSGLRIRKESEFLLDWSTVSDNVSLQYCRVRQNLEYSITAWRWSSASRMQPTSALICDLTGAHVSNASMQCASLHSLFKFVLIFKFSTRACSWKTEILASLFTSTLQYCVVSREAFVASHFRLLAGAGSHKLQLFGVLYGMFEQFSSSLPMFWVDPRHWGAPPRSHPWMC